MNFYHHTVLIKTLWKYYQSANRFYLLFFISGILTGLLIYFHSESSYEDRIFEALASDVVRKSNIDNNNANDKEILVNCLHIVHKSIINRQGLFTNISGMKGGVIHPLTVDLMTGDGACGSYALVLARLIKELGYEVRMVQMKVNGEFGGHIIVETQIENDNWIVLDPIYDLYFKRPDGKLASFDDVHSDWNFYKQRVPANYDLSYNYEASRYTNWDKIPVLMPAIKKILDWTIGKKKADTFSFRIIMLRKFYVFFIITLIVQLCLLIYIIYYARIKRKNSNQENIGEIITNNTPLKSSRKLKVKVIKADNIEQLESQ